MRKHDIKYSILDNQVIIPHRNSDNKLIGIRARNLEKTAVLEGRKYVPVLNGLNLLKPHPRCQFVRFKPEYEQYNFT